MPKDTQKDTRAALTVRLPRSTLDRFKREVERRGVSQSSLIELLMAGAFGAGQATVDERVINAAATACIAALDLVVMQKRDAAAVAKTAAKLEDFLEVFAQRSHL